MYLRRPLRGFLYQRAIEVKEPQNPLSARVYYIIKSFLI